MDEAAVRQGFLYLQLQQTFGGKKWRRFGAALYPESGCALARLELQEGPEKPRRGDAPRRVIRLCDCLRVAEAGGDAGSPRDTSPFVLETTERQYLLAAPAAERAPWVRAICLLAFPGQRNEAPDGQARPRMAENELYGSRQPVAPCKEFAVTVRPTEASERCRLRGSYTLRVGQGALELWRGPEPGTQLYNWPYRLLRRFGRDKVTFSFEAGRRCDSGEGTFEFETRQVSEIFQALDEAIAAQKNAPAAAPQTQPAAVPTVLPVALPRPESPYSRPHDSLPPPSPTVSVPSPRSRGPEGEYAVPFDAVARNLGKSLRSILAGPPKALGDPLYDSIQEHAAPLGPDHIYDEPEGMAALTLYDRPQEPQGEAWRRHAAPDRDPSGLQHVYPAGQELCAADWSQATEYDNVVLRKGPK
ncbi:docking protein 2 [Sorex araneus]|uniref:docking protein 2 n=1 Tax=Sorex araneus TaxID=42254 RepID=UPI0024334CD0|nr:docking protein 2 [Sorex araneus]